MEGQEDPRVLRPGLVQDSRLPAHPAHVYGPDRGNGHVPRWPPRIASCCRSGPDPDGWVVSRHPETDTTCQLDPRITATVCYFATDVHSRTLGPHESANTSATAPPSSNHTIDLFGKLKGEVSLIFGIKDTHVDDAGRDLIRAKLREAGVTFSWHEFAWAQHAFIRDELSKGRYDPAITKACFEVLLEVFQRTLKVDLGVKDATPQKLEHVC